MNLIQLTDDHMTRSGLRFPRGQYMYPSEASIKFIDQHGIQRTEGGCHREIYYKNYLSGVGAKSTPYQEWIFALGKAVEQILVEQYKQMGILVANNMKFQDVEKHLSGEIDVVVRDPETNELIVAEIKSFFSYNATRDICGNTRVKGSPKVSQLLQTLIYVDMGMKYNLFSKGKMVYYARDSGSRNEFNIELAKDGKATRPVIDGVIDYRFTMEDIYERYNILWEHLQNKTLPPRDYEFCYSPQKIEQLNTIGDIGKTAYIDYKKSPTKCPIGDWKCRYCAFPMQCKQD